MRYLVAAVMVAVVVAAALLPTPAAVDHEAEPGRSVPPVSICPIVGTGDRQTRVSVLSAPGGEGRFSSFAAGTETGAVDFSMGENGATSVLAGDVGAVGVTGGLIELPSDATGAGVVTSGSASIAAEACADIPTGQAFIAGGTTVTGALFEIQLINPYAGDATVDLTVTTDAGIESSDRFDAVVIPALSTITLDLSEIIPGREQVSANIETTRGSVLAYGRQTIEGETALWRAVAPAQDWWLPVPPGGGTKQMRIATAENAEVDYQVDFYGPDGFVEGHDTGVIDPRGTVTVPLAAVTSEAAAVRVITTAPVVPALRIDSDEGLAWTTASQVDAPTWLLPGARRAPDGGTGSVVILNTGIEAVTVSITRLADSADAQEMEIAAEGVLAADLRGANGYRVEATGPVVALWVSSVDGAGSAAIGTPLQDG